MKCLFSDAHGEWQTPAIVNMATYILGPEQECSNNIISLLKTTWRTLKFPQLLEYIYILYGQVKHMKFFILSQTICCFVQYYLFWLVTVFQESSVFHSVFYLSTFSCQCQEIRETLPLSHDLFPIFPTEPNYMLCDILCIFSFFEKIKAASVGCQLEQRQRRWEEF